MIPHIVFEALIKHYMYRTAPARIWFITAPIGIGRRLYLAYIRICAAILDCERRLKQAHGERGNRAARAAAGSKR